MDTKLRMWLESQDIAHVLAVAKNSMVVTMQLTEAPILLGQTATESAAEPITA